MHNPFNCAQLTFYFSPILCFLWQFIKQTNKQRIVRRQRTPEKKTTTQKHQLKHSCFDSALMFAAFHKQSLRMTMLFLLLNKTKSLLNTKKIVRAAILDHVWNQNYFFLLFSRLHDQTLYQCHARQHEVAKGSNICDVNCCMKIFDLDQMSKAILPRRISVEIRKGSKERRKGENGLRLSFLSFKCSLAFRHQPFPRHSRFALASVRKTKRLRRRQRLNSKAHSSKAMLDEHVWSFSFGVTTESTSGWNLFRRCCPPTLDSWKLETFRRLHRENPGNEIAVTPAFHHLTDDVMHDPQLMPQDAKIFTIFGEESRRYDHLDLEGF